MHCVGLQTHLLYIYILMHVQLLCVCVCVCVCVYVHAYMHVCICCVCVCEMIPVHQILEVYRLGSFGSPLGSCRIHIAEYSCLTDIT